MTSDTQANIELHGELNRKRNLLFRCNAVSYTLRSSIVFWRPAA